MLVFTPKILILENHYLEYKSLDHAGLKETVLVFTLEIFIAKYQSLESKSLDLSKLNEAMFVFTSEIFILENPSLETKLPMCVLRPEILTPKIHSLGSRY